MSSDFGQDSGQEQKRGSMKRMKAKIRMEEKMALYWLAWWKANDPKLGNHHREKPWRRPGANSRRRRVALVAPSASTPSRRDTPLRPPRRQSPAVGGAGDGEADSQHGNLFWAVERSFVRREIYFRNKSSSP